MKIAGGGRGQSAADLARWLLFQADVALPHATIPSAHQRRWALALLLGFAALNAFGGGIYGLLGADGVPKQWLTGSPFDDYTVPSAFLIVVVGGSFLAAAVAAALDAPRAGTWAQGAAILCLTWLVAQVAFIGLVSWMQPVTAAYCLLIAVLSLRSKHATSVPAPPERAASSAAAAVVVGIVLSGPAAVWLVATTHPQPPWQGASTFYRHYHSVQLVPYLGGIVLVVASLLLIASLHALAPPQDRLRSSIAVILTGVFATMIFANYAVQTTFLPSLAKSQDAANDALVAALSMSNPTSLAWALEMWGWGFFGVATWLVAPVFDGRRLGRTCAMVFRANGAFSALGVAWTVAYPGWVMTTAGLGAFTGWNLLLVTMALLARAALDPPRHQAPLP